MVAKLHFDEYSVCSTDLFSTCKDCLQSTPVAETKDTQWYSNRGRRDGAAGAEEFLINPRSEDMD
jgi:hypothetical protein